MSAKPRNSWIVRPSWCIMLTVCKKKISAQFAEPSSYWLVWQVNVLNQHMSATTGAHAHFSRKKKSSFQSWDNFRETIEMWKEKRSGQVRQGPESDAKLNKDATETMTDDDDYSDSLVWCR